MVAMVHMVHDRCICQSFMFLIVNVKWLHTSMSSHHLKSSFSIISLHCSHVTYIAGLSHIMCGCSAQMRKRRQQLLEHQAVTSILQLPVPQELFLPLCSTA